MNGDAHWGLCSGVHHVGMTALTTDGMETIMVSVMEDARAPPELA